MTITRPLDKQITAAQGGTLKLEWDKFFNDAAAALNNIQLNTSFTMAAAATKTVSDKRVTASSCILLYPTNAAGGTLEGAATHLYISSRSAGVSFTVATANGVAAAGTETFSYAIIG